MTKTVTKSTSNLAPWLALFMGGLFYCFQFLVRVSPNVMTDELMLSFLVDAAGLSFIIAWSNAGYSMMQIPLGVLMDRLGPRRIIAAGAILCAVSTYFFSIATTPYLAGASRFMIGIGSACGYLGTLKLGSQWFTRDKMPMVVSITMTLGIVGASIGGLPLEFLVNSVGWQSSLHLVALAGMIIGAAVLFVVGKNPPYHAHAPEEDHLLVDLFAIVKKPQAWLFAIFGMLMYLPLDLMGTLWGVSFLEKKFNIPESEATVPILFMFIGVALGSFFFAWLTDAWNSRKKPMVLGAILTTALYFLIVFGPPLSIELVCVLFLLSGFFFNGQLLAFTCICEIMPLHASGVAVGFVNSIVMLGGFFFMPLVGEILVAFWDGTMLDGVPQYSAADFQIAIAIIPICLGIAFLMTKGIRETIHLHKPVEK